MTTFVCAIPTCNKKLSRRFLMCSAHWAKVPMVLQQAVEKTQYQWAHNADSHPQHLKMLRHNVMMARAVAIAAVCDPAALVPPP